MKQNDLQTLLDKFREGTLTDGERSELERLSHKEEVFSAARSQASGILRRRMALAMSALLICGAGIWAVMGGGGAQTPMMAENTTPVPEAPEEVREMVAPTAPTEVAPLVAEAPEIKRPAISHHEVRPAVIAPVEEPAMVATTETPSSEPVVMCNNQCDADSVINDIRKFLAYEGL